MRKQVLIEQRTPEWLAWKKGRVGASDAPVLLKVSPYKTELQLYEEKVKEKQVAVNNSMRAGTQYEDAARELACSKLGVDYKPACFNHPYRPYMCASLDGWNESHGVLELKLANAENHEMAKAGIIPAKYVPQTQAQAATAVHKFGAYGSYTVRDGKIFDITFVMFNRDHAMIEQIEQAAEAFNDRIISFEEPEPSERDFIRIADPNGLGKKLRTICLQRKQLAESIELIENEILELAGYRNVYLDDLKVQKCSRKGSVDYSKIPELKGLNLDLYRKPRISYYRFD